LWHRIDSVYGLDDIADAHERQESGLARGKVLIKP
jgi:NADPH:quinone reductase-like Zn-dependent oxidoreductase